MVRTTSSTPGGASALGWHYCGSEALEDSCFFPTLRTYVPLSLRSAAPLPFSPSSSLGKAANPVTDSPVSVADALSVGGWGAFFLTLGVLFRQAVPWRKVSIASQSQYYGALEKRLGVLERRLERQQARHNAERSIDRHRLNNVTACFDAMVLMLKTSPERATEIVREIEEMRKRQREEEALEKARIHAAMLATAGAEEDDIDAAEVQVEHILAEVPNE